MNKEQTYALRGLLHAAGIRGEVTEVPNRYWPDHSDYDDVRTPWLRVFTRRGVIVLGWRKRVISLDWSDSVLGKQGPEVVSSPEVTHSARAMPGGTTRLSPVYGDCGAPSRRTRESWEAP